MEDYNDSDTSSESEYESSQGFAAESDFDEDEPSKDLEPELTENYDGTLCVGIVAAVATLAGYTSGLLYGFTLRVLYSVSLFG
jgi:hypothetical protein